MASNISRQRYLFTEPGTYYIDLFRSLSAQERKMFRQGQVAHVHGGLIKDSNNESVVRMNVAPDTWVTRTAWRRGQRLWMQMINGALEASKGINKSKYTDYKVYLNSASATAYSVLPVDASGATIPSGEWIYSKYHSEDVDWSDPALLTNTNRQADTFNAHIVGEHGGTPANWTRVGLIRSWIDSRAQPDDFPQGNLPATISTDPLMNLFDEADAADEIIDSLRADNDEPPYDEDLHFGIDPAVVSVSSGGHLQRVAMAATQAGAGQIASLNGFSAICGLVQVHITQGSPSGEVELILDVSTKGGKI